MALEKQDEEEEEETEEATNEDNTRLEKGKKMPGKQEPKKSRKRPMERVMLPGRGITTVEIKTIVEVVHLPKILVKKWQLKAESEAFA